MPETDVQSSDSSTSWPILLTCTDDDDAEWHFEDTAFTKRKGLRELEIRCKRRTHSAYAYSGYSTPQNIPICLT